jgi:hypothetical protein
MYRNASLRPLCEDCGVESAGTAMTFSPDGGYLCWTCQLRRQICEHQVNAARWTRMQRLPQWTRTAWMVALIVVICSGALIGCFGWVLLLHCC